MVHKRLSPRFLFTKMDVSANSCEVPSDVPYVRFAAFACGLLSTLLSACGDPTKSPAELTRDAAALMKIIPALEAQLVTEFRYQDGSKVLNYKRGLFADVSTKSQTPRSSALFDSTAESDLESLWGKINSTKTDVMLITEANYESTGHLAYAEFHFSNRFGRQMYVYHPSYTLPADMSHERWHTRIDDNWYHRRDDWN